MQQRRKHRTHSSFRFKTPVHRSGSKLLSKLCIPLLVRFTLIISPAVYPVQSRADGCDRITALEQFENTGFTPEGSTCMTFLGMSNLRGISCSWAFPFRSEDAAGFFDDAWGELTDCRTGIQSPYFDSVNHPDSYRLRELIAENGTYRVAIKDKSQESRTYIFLRLESHD